MTKLSLAGAFSAVVLAAGCSRPAQSAADTATASSSVTQVATPPADTVSTTTVTTSSSSTVTHKSSGKKSSGPTTRKTGTKNAVCSADASSKDSILGPVSVILFP